MILHLLRLLRLSLPLISLCLQMGSLTSVSDVCNLLTINPLVVLHQNAHMIHSKSSNGWLLLENSWLGRDLGPPSLKSIILYNFSNSYLSVLEAVAIRAPMMYVAPSTPSHANSYRVSDCAISHLVPL